MPYVVGVAAQKLGNSPVWSGTDPGHQLLSFSGGVYARGEGLTEQMAGMTSKLTRLLVGAAMGAGAVGVILALAGVHSPVRTGLVLLFLVVAPTAAIAGLLRSFDPFARLILAVVTTVAVFAILATLLLSAGLWSPIGELIGVALITVICLAAQVPAVRARIAAWAGPPWRALARRIPGLRTLVHGPAETAPAGAAGNGHAGGYVAEVKLNGDGPADADTAVIDMAEGHQPEPDDADSTPAAGNASPTEATTPLPAIHD